MSYANLLFTRGIRALSRGRRRLRRPRCHRSRSARRLRRRACSRAAAEARARRGARPLAVHEGRAPCAHLLTPGGVPVRHAANGNHGRVHRGGRPRARVPFTGRAGPLAARRSLAASGSTSREQVRRLLTPRSRRCRRQRTGARGRRRRGRCVRGEGQGARSLGLKDQRSTTRRRRGRTHECACPR